jgi:hypothetical protein
MLWCAAADQPWRRSSWKKSLLTWIDISISFSVTIG